MAPEQSNSMISVAFQASHANPSVSLVNIPKRSVGHGGVKHRGGRAERKNDAKQRDDVSRKRSGTAVSAKKRQKLRKSWGKSLDIQKLVLDRSDL